MRRILRSSAITKLFFIGLSALMALMPISPVVAESATPVYEWTSYVESVAGIGAGIDELVTASDGSVYALGSFFGTVDFDPEGAGDVRASTGASDIFVIKWNNDGSYAWARSIGSASGEFVGSFPEQFIELDSSNNVYFTGIYNGTINFNPLGLDSRTAVSDSDPFVTKWNSDGSYGWTHTFGSPAVTSSPHEAMVSLQVDSDGTTYVGGDFSGTTDFDPAGASDVQSVVNIADRDAYVTRINSNGTYGWTNTYGGDGRDYVNLQNLELAGDGSGELFVLVNFDGTDIDMDPSAGTTTITQEGGAGDTIAISRFDASGNLIWANGFGNASFTDANQIRSDSDGNLYLQGIWGGTLDFDFGAGSDSDTVVTGSADGFVMRVNSDGSYDWSRRYDTIDENNGLELGAEGVYSFMTSNDSGTFDVNRPGPTVNISQKGDWDNYITKWDLDGNHQWTNRVASVEYDYGYELSVNAQCDSVYTLIDSYGSGGGTNLDFDDAGGDIRLIPTTGAYAVSRFSTLGQYNWTRLVDTADSFFYVTRSSIGPSDSIYIAGQMEGANINFNDGGSDVVSVASESVAVVTKWSNTSYRQHVINLGTSIDALEESTGDDARLGNAGVARTSSTTIRVPDADNGLAIADIGTDLSCDRDWSSVNGESDNATGRAFIENLTSAEGTDSNLNLYVPLQTGALGVGVCPGASSLAALTSECSGYYEIANGDAGLSQLDISGQDYWAVLGVTDGGAFNITELSDPPAEETLAPTGISPVISVFAGMIIVGLLYLVARRTYIYRDIRFS